MSQIPMFRLNYPIETPEALLFWGSKHRSNHIKAVIAFSLDKDNAMDNLRRHCISYNVRRRAVKVYKQHINNPSMQGIYFSEMKDPWWMYT